MTLWTSMWVGPLLSLVSPKDRVVYAIVGAVLLGTATVASMVPARRAAKVDPNVALKAE